MLTAVAGLGVAVGMFECGQPLHVVVELHLLQVPRIAGGGGLCGGGGVAQLVGTDVLGGARIQVAGFDLGDEPGLAFHGLPH